MATLELTLATPGNRVSLGLEKQALLHELRDPEGFPAMTGHVRFDVMGIGQKQLDIFSIKKGKVVPAG